VLHNELVLGGLETEDRECHEQMAILGDGSAMKMKQVLFRKFPRGELFSDDNFLCWKFIHADVDAKFKWKLIPTLS
jgi:hypothetical protein